MFYPLFRAKHLPMVWDYGEMNPFAGSAGDWVEANRTYLQCYRSDRRIRRKCSADARLRRATSMSAGAFDAVVTDPPYYDNVPYATFLTSSMSG